MSACLVSICMHEAIPLIHGLSLAPLTDVRFNSYFQDEFSVLIE